MKHFFNTAVTILVLLVLVYSCNSAKTAQKSRADQDSVASWWQHRQFVFHATNAQPMSGRNVNLTSDYTFEMRNDSIIAWLPYFGRSFIAPTNAAEGGIKFATDSFTIKDEKKEKNLYKMLVVPNGLPAFQNTKDVQQLWLSIGTSGYGTLQIQSLNQTPISFYGYLTGKW
ncbi:MAG: DUF4251 domain-containing protein [Chitinophagaceae bacterium]